MGVPIGPTEFLDYSASHPVPESGNVQAASWHPELTSPPSAIFIEFVGENPGQGLTFVSKSGPWDQMIPVGSLPSGVFAATYDGPSGQFTLPFTIESVDEFEVILDAPFITVG